MRILQATARYFPAIGGVEDFVRNLSEQLVIEGHEVTAVALDFHTPPESLRPPCGPEIIEGVEIRRFKTRYPLGLDYPSSWSLLTYLAKWSGDIMHAHCYWYFPGDAAVLVSKLRKKPFLYTSYFYPALSGMRKLYSKLMNPIISRAYRVVAISKFEYGLLADMGIPESRLTIIPPGMKIDKAQTPRQNIFEKLGIAHKTIVLSINRLSVEKHVEVLIRAAPKVIKVLPDAHFVVVGPDFGQKKNYLEEVRNLALQKYFTFTGTLSKSDIFSAYQHADLFCHTADGELFGITLMEALACGLPVVAVDTMAVPEIICHEKHGFLYPFGDVHALADFIIYLLQNKQEAEQMAMQGKKFVEDRFDIKNITQQYQELYQLR